MNTYLIPGITQVWTGNFTFLVMASAFIRLLKDRLAINLYVELVQRLRSWWIIYGIFTLIFIANARFFLVFLALISFLAFKEFVSIIPLRKDDRKAVLLAYVCIPFQYLWISLGWHRVFILFIPVFMFLLLQACLMTQGKSNNYLRSVASIYLGLMITVFSLSHIGILMNLHGTHGTGSNGACLVIYLLLLTQFNDVSQYIWGKCLGKIKIIPEISPNKTQAGFVGGIITTILLSLLIAPVLTPFSPETSLFMGMLIAISGFFGDLSISAIKRDLGIKNTGTLLPGHGGILDRVDSLTFTAPVFFHIYYYYSTIPGFTL